ncbi:hypothetical protein NKR23_g608 [Pleurostoma richardsiae]|uniref:Uncharacterized protein n=1 Tax=Pleurostoma richardsiae TaxID=41990 RepID=A0AA38RVD6_9PEZI|nr:hypothetical protein NKR23_g608 [Pleurostoma richardsiae]
MRPSLVLSFVSAALVTATEPRNHAPAAFFLGKRALMSCEETYGTGSVQCGNSNSTMCYNPTLGQTCCEDSGYCDKGTYCAPVAGYCCLDAEDVETCAQNAGFSLPANFSAASVDSARASITVTAFEGITLTSAATLTAVATESIALTVPSATISLAAPTGALPGNGRGNETSTSATTTSIPIQVSVARKEQLTLALMTAGIAAVGLFMSCC